MSPETLTRTNLDLQASDIWSLGCILYELLTGQAAFQGKTVEEIKKKICDGNIYLPSYISSKAKDLIRNILKIKPTERITISNILKHRFFEEDIANVMHSDSRKSIFIERKKSMVSMRESLRGSIILFGNIAYPKPNSRTYRSSIVNNIAKSQEIKKKTKPKSK
jgi:serine/threonine protein kinase